MTKHQHYVPQFYLKEFASEDGQIWVYDKLTDKSFRTIVRNVAGERYFYDSDGLEKATGDRQAVEKYLSALEGHFRERIGRLLMRLRSGGYQRLHPETKGTISIFAAFQLVRTKEHRIQSRQISEQFLKFLRKHPGSEKLVAEVEASMSEHALREAHARQLLDLPEILRMATILSSHIWVIGKQHVSQSFYTSDAPITKHSNVKITGRGNDGIACEGIEVHVPISHDFNLMLYERKHFEDVAHMDGHVLELNSSDYMVYQRQFPVKYSSCFVFCREDDFELARTICAEEPHWRDENRKRVTSNHDDDTSQFYPPK